MIAALSCDPIGTEETKVWVTGYIYEDSLLGEGLEGALVMLEMDPDSFMVTSSTAMTNADGRFMMEIQVYPFLPEEGTTGYSMPGLIFFGLSTSYGSWSYVYRTMEDPFIVGIGDTLYVWPILFGAGNGTGSGG